MAAERFGTDDVLGMLDEDYSDMEVDEESDFFDSDMEISDDGNSAPGDDSDNDVSSSDDDAVGGNGWRAWRNTDNDFFHHPFTANNVGANLEHIPETELECFQSFMTDEILMELVVATNAYASIKLGQRRFTKNFVWYGWRDVTLPELKAYLEVVLKMALIEKPDIKDYFSRKWTEYCPFFLEVFSRRRFLQIHWMLHVKSPEPTTAPITRGSKMKNFVSYIQEKCLQNFTPRQNIAVDESTVGFKGRIAFKTYNPQKPSKWGLRVYVLSDSESGYVSAFEPYFGKTTTDSLSRPDMPFTSRIVLHLVCKLLAKVGGSGYHVYTDRFYTSYTLAKELLQNRVHLTGTVQKNRVGLPSEIKRLRLQNLQIRAYRHPEGILTLGWQDRRLILMLSTWHNVDTVPHHRWRQGRQEDVEKPVVICDYTSHMGAVDRSDHYCASYSFTRKTLRWWRKLLFWLIEVCMVNSFLLYKEVHQLHEARHLRYRNNVIVQLVGEIRNKDPNRGRPSTSDAAERLNKAPHFIAKGPRGHNKNCMVCSSKEDRKTTLFFCETCQRKPGLHPGECFKKYHTQVNYKG